MEHKASIAIFHKSINYTDDTTQPHTPDTVFEAAQRVIESKGSEMIKSRDGMYFVQYSETGPFNAKIDDKWLPVFIMRLREWQSGGITENEMKKFNERV